VEGLPSGVLHPWRRADSPRAPGLARDAGM